MTSLNNTKLFSKWLKTHNSNKNENTHDGSSLLDFKDWINKQMSAASPNLSPVNWKDYKQEMIKPSDYVGVGGDSTGATGFTLPPLQRKTLGGRNFKLVPQRTMVRRVGKAPYFATRWRKIAIDDTDKGFTIIPVDDFEGDIDVLFETWKNYIDTKDDMGDQKFVVPLVALQEIIHKEYDGILMQREKRIVGVVSVNVDENNEAEISLLSAAPLEIEEGIEEEIEEALQAGIKQYIRHRGYETDSELFDDEEEDDTDNDEEQEKDNEDSIDIDVSEVEEKDEDDDDEVAIDIIKAKSSAPETIFRMMVVRGLYPKTGRPENPGAWVKRRTFENNMKNMGFDPSDMKTQMDSFREQHRSKHFFEFQPLFYQERLATLQRLAVMNRTANGKFAGKDGNALSTQESQEALSDIAIEEVMNMMQPTLAQLNDVPDEGAIIKVPAPYQGKRKAEARRAENYVSIEDLLGEGYASMNERALNDWFRNEYLKGRDVYQATTVLKPHWEDVMLAEDPNDPNVDLLITAKDPKATDEKYSTKYIFSYEYEQQQAESKESRVRAFLPWMDLLTARGWKDLRRTEAPQTKTKPINLDKMRSAALAMLIQDEFLLRSGNQDNIGGKAGQVDEHKGTLQLSKENVRFDDEGNAMLSFIGKKGEVYANLKINNPELSQHIKERWDNTTDGRIFSHDYMYGLRYLKNLTNNWFTQHDIRTAHSNRVVLEYVDKIRRENDMPKTGVEFAKKAREIGNYVAGMLNHSGKNEEERLRTVFRSYITQNVLLELGSHVDNKAEVVQAYESLPNVFPISKANNDWLINFNMEDKKPKRKRGRK